MSEKQDTRQQKKTKGSHMKLLYYNALTLKYAIIISLYLSSYIHIHFAQSQKLRTKDMDISGFKTHYHYSCTS